MNGEEFVEYTNNDMDYVVIEDYVERIYSALPGKLVEVHVTVGDDVNIGDQIATISAMKMETPVHTHVKGNVIYINNKELKIFRLHDNGTINWVRNEMNIIGLVLLIKNANKYGNIFIRIIETKTD